MAVITNPTHTGSQPGSVFSPVIRLVEHIRRKIVWQRAYNETYYELGKLGTHELEDIGICRADIMSLACDAADGAVAEVFGH